MKKTAEKLSGYMSYINALAYRDSLTGVKNSTAYKEMATTFDIKLRMREMSEFAVLVADINGLKVANDKYGHDIGNKLIIKAAKIICDVFKHSPVFRIGGDEFVVVMQGEDYEKREQLLEEMNERCPKAFVGVGNDRISVSIALGIAAFDAGYDETLEDVFSRADRKMYKDKEAYKKNHGAENT